MNSNSIRHKSSNFENQKKELVEKFKFSLDQEYIIKSLILSNDSWRSKYIEQLISHALTPMNYIGEGDVCDIWLSFANINLGLKGEHVENYAVYNDEFKCSSINSGFAIEVKCTRKDRFKVEPKEGYYIPDSNAKKGITIKNKQMWSDFYIFIKFRNNIVELNTTESLFDNIANSVLPEDSVEKIYLIPTFILYNNSANSSRDGSVRESSRKSITIGKKFLNDFYLLPLPDFRDPDNIYKIIIQGIKDMLSLYNDKFYEYRKMLDKIKSHKCNY